MIAYETMTVNGYTVEIWPDDDPLSPRDADNLGVLFAPHERYELGDEGYQDLSPFKRAADYFHNRAESRAAFNRMFTLYVKTYHGASVVLPVALIDHSGLSMWVGSEASPADPGGWDSGQIGWIFDTAETREMTGCPLEQMAEGLRAEVKEYDRYLTGDAWGYRIFDSEGEEIDACWGFLGLEYATEQATAIAESLPAWTPERAEQARREALTTKLAKLDEQRAALVLDLAATGQETDQ